MFLCRKGSSYDANDTKLMYSWIKNERWHKHKLIVVEIVVLLMNCHVMLRLLRGKLLTLGGVRGFCTTEHRKQRDILVQEVSVMCGVGLLEGGTASRCGTQPQHLMDPPPVPSSSLSSLFFIHLEGVCDKWRRGRCKSLSGCTGVPKLVFQIYCNKKYVLDLGIFY